MEKSKQFCFEKLSTFAGLTLSLLLPRSVSSVISPSRFVIVLPFGDLPLEHLDTSRRSLASGSFEILHREMQVQLQPAITDP